MSKITAEQVESLAAQLAAIAAIFSPGSAAAVAGIIGVATDLNRMVHEIKNQDDATAQAVWAEVSSGYSDSLALFQASVEKHAGA